MKINLAIVPTNLMNFNRIHQSTSWKNDDNNSAQLPKIERKDNVTISPQGKKNNLLANLMKQKLRIAEQKDALVSSTLEKGSTLDTIKSQLEAYAEQLKNIDEQITEVAAKEIEQQTEKLKNNIAVPAKTEEEIKNEQLSSITSLSTDLQQTKVISSVQTKVAGNIRVVKAEIKADKMRGGSGETITKKEEKVARMEKSSSNLTSKISDKLAELSEKVNDLNKPQEILPNDEDKRADKAQAFDFKEELSPNALEDKTAEKVATE